ncbi:MAG: hypothetical protein KJ971_01830 [Firmicutes bacterium]|nr:hypothetical protein [Bacillota bacterium]
MEKKLNEFVINYFDVEERVVNEEAIKEISSNLIDRYHDLLIQGKSEEQAYIECVSSLGDIRKLLTQDKQVNASNITVQMQVLLFFLSSISIVSFFFSSGVGLGFLLISIILFSYLYLNIYKKAKQGFVYNNGISFMEELLKLTKSLFPLMVMWIISASLLILETILILFSNIDKLIIQMFYQSTPVAIFFLMWLLIFVVTFVFVFPNYAMVIKRYQFISKNNTTVFLFNKIIDKMKPQKYKSYSIYKKRIYLKYVILSILHVFVTMFANTKEYYHGPIVFPDGDIQIRTILSDTSPFWEKLLQNISSFWVILLFIILVTGVVSFLFALNYKPLILKRIFLMFNVFWLIGILIIAISFMFYTGVIHDFSMVIYYSLGIVAIQFAFLILNRKIKELLYE